MNCDIELSFLPSNGPWHAALSAAHEYRRLPEAFWQLLESTSEEWQDFLELSWNKQYPEFIELSEKDEKLHLELSGGSESFAVTKALMFLFHDAGCTAIEALIYTDESDRIEDADGVFHRLGLKYYFDEDGDFTLADYPEIAYE